MNDVPTIQVPVNVFLDLVRTYKEEPQELINRQTSLLVDTLEKRAYRKYLAFKKEQRK